uniref:Sulfotransferase domain-containing protein n=1 Tax=Paramoeba aestuarina TaxID=180227 RepID=A0A7S4PMQ8_9EUKA|mmetsp:Transcript_9226/g.13980  ORF Transcript_9226/g.13980 Transcript_9226/m.13980 type:complete len:346 (+) Transcript_9226:69-1106(+)
MGVVFFFFLFAPAAVFSFGQITEQRIQQRTIRSEFMELSQARAVPKSCSPLPSSLSVRNQAFADLHGIVASPGGTGSTHVLRRASNESFSVNRGNAEHLKHCHLPPFHNSSLIRGTFIGNTQPSPDFDLFKAIIVYGDPAHSIHSLFRRHFQKKQIRDTSARTCHLPTLRTRHGHYKELPGFLESYVKHAGNEDRFRFNEYYLNWMFGDCPYDRIFISGEHSADVLHSFPIRSLFLHSPFSTTAHSSNREDLTWKLKNSKLLGIRPYVHTSHPWESVPEDIKSTLGSPFEALQLFLKKLPPIFIRLGTPNSNSYSTANASTFKQKFADKFIGDFDMDEVLDSVLP